LGLLELGAVAAAVGVPVAIGLNAGLGLVLWLSSIAFTPLLAGLQKPEDDSSSTALGEGRAGGT
jgi:hypothetical protein